MKNNEIGKECVTKRDGENFTVGQKVIAVKDIWVEANDCSPGLHYASKDDVLIVRKLNEGGVHRYGVSHERVVDRCFWVAGDEIRPATEQEIAEYEVRANVGHLS